MSDKTADAPLVIESGMHGKTCVVRLNGVDISRYLRGVTVNIGVDDLSTATLEYIGAVVVKGDMGRFELQQAPVYVECESCKATVKGQKHQAEIIETTPLATDIEAVQS